MVIKMYLNKDICIEGNPILREKCKKVKLPLSQEDLDCLKNLYQYVVISEIDSLVAQYGIKPGVGLAAPQVGVDKRMFAINCNDFLDPKNTKYSFAVVNPEIIGYSEEMVYLPGGEGCLSVVRDTKHLVTPRHYAIKFRAGILDMTTNKIKMVTKTLVGYPAIVFQHEYDHLDGIMFVDKMYPVDEVNAEPLFEYED